jgi:hypothetical protein
MQAIRIGRRSVITVGSALRIYVWCTRAHPVDLRDQVMTTSPVLPGSGWHVGGCRARSVADSPHHERHSRADPWARRDVLAEAAAAASPGRHRLPDLSGGVVRDRDWPVRHTACSVVAGRDSGSDMGVSTSGLVGAPAPAAGLAVAACELHVWLLHRAGHHIPGREPGAWLSDRLGAADGSRQPDHCLALCGGRAAVKGERITTSRESSASHAPHGRRPGMVADSHGQQRVMRAPGVRALVCVPDLPAQTCS